MDTAERLKHYLHVTREQYPEIWTQVECLRSLRGIELPDWPAWCYLPLSGAYAIASGGGDNRLKDATPVGVIGALAAWRATQGIYRLHEELFESVWNTPIEQVPSEVLYQLPEWCIYVETPGRHLDGFFAHLDWDVHTGRTELRLLLDIQGYLSPLPLHLTQPTLEECLTEAIAEAQRQAAKAGLEQLSRDKVSRMIRESLPNIARYVSLLLYICAAAGERDIKDDRGSERQPGNPAPKKTKKGVKVFAPPGPTTWDVGWRMGAALGAAKRAYEETADMEQAKGTHASPRPHVRVAHFHHFWTGPLAGERKLMVKWLPPIPVRMDLGEIIPTVRKVQ